MGGVGRGKEYNTLLDAVMMQCLIEVEREFISPDDVAIGAWDREVVCGEGLKLDSISSSGDGDVYERDGGFRVASVTDASFGDDEARLIKSDCFISYINRMRFRVHFRLIKFEWMNRFICNVLVGEVDVAFRDVDFTIATFTDGDSHEVL